MKLLLKRSAIAALSSLVLLSVAGAVDNPERAQKMMENLKSRFEQADANHDGRLTRDEAKDKMPRIFKHFDEIDSNHQGSISLEDIIAYGKAKRAEKQVAP